MNVKFEYLYRDAGNNKKWGEVIFKNQENIGLRLLDTKLRNILIDSEFFIAKKSGLPKLSFQERDEELDHDWYEYWSLENTDEQESDFYNRNIKVFINSLKHAVI